MVNLTCLIDQPEITGRPTWAEIDLDALIPKLEAIAKNGYDERIYVRGDTSANYGTVMKLMGALNQAGYRKIALVTGSEPEQKKADAN